MPLLTPLVEFAISLSKYSDGEWINISVDKLNKADNAVIFVDRDDKEQIAEATKRLDMLRAHCETNDDLKAFKGSMRAYPATTKTGEKKTRVVLNRRASLSFAIEDLVGTAVESTS